MRNVNFRFYSSNRLADLGSIVLDGLPNGGMAESMTVGVSETEEAKVRSG